MKYMISIKRVAGIFVLFLVLATAVVALVACTENPAAEPAGDDTGRTVEIISPADGATLPPGDITVTVQVTNFKIVDKQGQANVPGEGHVHFYLDVAAPTTPGKPAIPAGGEWAHVSGTTYTFKNVPEGTHTIAVELVNNDHTPLNPPAVYEITLNVSSQGPYSGGYVGSENITPPANTGGPSYGY
jgi:Domain of unknown function (DUF4399)